MTSAAPSSSPVSITEEWLVGPLSTPFYTRTWQPKEEERTLVFVHGKVPPPSRPLSAVPSRTLSLDEQAGVGCASADMTSDVFSTHHRLLSLRSFNEHVTRYDHYFTLLAQLTNARIFAYDQRGFGHTAHTLVPSSPDHSHLKGTKRSKKGITNTSQQRIDIEFWVRKEAERRGGKVWLMGHSMGGALVLGIPTHAATTASKAGAIEVPLISLLEGIISSSPLIHQTHPAPKWQVSLGNGAANLTSLFANRHIPAPVDPAKLTRDPVKVEENRKDPLCPQSASLGALGPMLLTGQALLTEGAPANWPVELPLLIVHGSADEITSPKASHEFHSSLPTEHNKNKYISVDGGFHELANEPSPVWENFAKDVSEFILAHDSSKSTPKAPAGEGQAARL